MIEGMLHCPFLREGEPVIRPITPDIPDETFYQGQLNFRRGSIVEITRGNRVIRGTYRACDNKWVYVTAHTPAKQALRWPRQHVRMV